MQKVNGSTISLIMHFADLLQPPQLEQMLMSSCEFGSEVVADLQGNGDMMGVGIGEGSSLMGDRHFPN